MTSLSHQEYAEEDLKTYQILKNKSEIELHTYCGIELEIHPNVFSPKYFTDSFWFAEEISRIVGKSKFLEIGTGTGVIALFAALNGARVTATDINPAAIENCKANFKRHNLASNVILSDLFSNLSKEEKFDFIFWNHPFFEAEERIEDLLIRAGFDFHYEGLEAYLAQAHSFLSKNGEVLLGTGNAAKLDRIFEICQNLSLNYELLKQVEMPVNPGSSIMNDYRIYAISKVKT